MLTFGQIGLRRTPHRSLVADAPSIVELHLSPCFLPVSVLSHVGASDTACVHTVTIAQTALQIYRRYLARGAILDFAAVSRAIFPSALLASRQFDVTSECAVMLFDDALVLVPRIILFGCGGRLR
jgi:hypothetical protein